LAKDRPPIAPICLGDGWVLSPWQRGWGRCGRHQFGNQETSPPASVAANRGDAGVPAAPDHRGSPSNDPLPLRRNYPIHHHLRTAAAQADRKAEPLRCRIRTDQRVDTGRCKPPHLQSLKPQIIGTPLTIIQFSAAGYWSWNVEPTDRQKRCCSC